MGRMGRVHELPEPVRNVLEARTGDAVLVVDCDYRIVYWDDRMESLTSTLAEEVVRAPFPGATRRTGEG